MMEFRSSCSTSGKINRETRVSESDVHAEQLWREHSVGGVESAEPWYIYGLEES